MRFEGKVVIVTGAGSGIGEATARRFSEEGAAVVLVGDHRKKVETVAGSLPKERTRVHKADVSKYREVEAAVESTVKHFGALHVIVNNAGIFKGSTVTKTKPSEWQQVMDTNAGGVFNGSRAALPHLVRSKGCIVNTASVSGLGADWQMSAYNASKGAIVNLTRAMALDYGRKGVRVNAVCPSFTLTGMTEDMAKDKKLVAKFMERMPMGRIIMPADVAAVIAFLASDDARMVTGVNLPVDGGVGASNGQPAMG
ncbi:MAG TPA: SDR family oxidoreductase [Usitatibacter sp.]|jgi:meso-butanediol dehydrogenase/(S,S)-butanediol dehydrogenase/diacetyl reductase|nr:SDR family oxidoreductase [Usitatibacter sp.]